MESHDARRVKRLVSKVTRTTTFCVFSSFVFFPQSWPQHWPIIITINYLIISQILMFLTAFPLICPHTRLPLQVLLQFFIVVASLFSHAVSCRYSYTSFTPFSLVLGFASVFCCYHILISHPVSCRYSYTSFTPFFPSPRNFECLICFFLSFSLT